MRIHDFFRKCEGQSLTYDDLIFFPGYVDFPIDSVNLSTQLTEKIHLNIPIISSPMDTVTESELAIALALQGGLGLIHYNLSPEEQLRQITKVKRFKNGFVSEPMALPPSAGIRDAVSIRKEYGYSTIPITEDGNPHGRLVGMISRYDYSTFDDLDKGVAERMLPLRKLTLATFEDISSKKGTLDLNRANHLLLDGHSAAMPVVDREGRLRYLITRSDLEKHQNYPHATLDNSKRLLVGAAVETWRDKAEERLAKIHEVVDVIVFDTSQGYTSYEIDLVKWVKNRYPDLQIIAGNVVCDEACKALINAGADAIRIGMGCGSICTTQEVGGVGRAQATAVYSCVKACRGAGIGIIADGGISKSSDIVKALGLGARAVMLGSLLACTNEAPGHSQIKDGIRLKEYRGMGSGQAMERGSAIRYGVENSQVRVPEGVWGIVPSRGSVSEWVPVLIQGVRQGFHKLGFSSISSVQEKIDKNEVMIERRSEESKREGNVHNLYEVGIDGGYSGQEPKEVQPPKELVIDTSVHCLKGG